MAGIAGVSALAACTPTPGGGTPPTDTTINSFTVSDPSGPAPHTAAFSWSISDPENDPLTCTLDWTTDGTVDVTVAPCTNSSLRAHTYPSAGSFTTTLVVDDQNSTPASATASTTVSAPSSDLFDITLRLSTGMTSAQAQAFDDAAARWSTVIAAGLDPRTVTIPAGDCDPAAAQFDGTIDDVMIDGIIAPIDGPGGVLGQAGPCYVRGSSRLPIYGTMTFDSADVVDLEADGTFEDVILHEMGHVLGIGTLWDPADIGGTGTSNPTHLGVTTRAAYSMLGASGNVPLENVGGAGTVESHWREATFGSELMTGFIDSTNPMSIVTIADLADLGYSGIDLGGADPYSLGSSSRRTPGADGRELTEVLLTPRRTV